MNSQPDNQPKSIRQVIHRMLMSKGRLEALTDGIFAIAMTLLVLELKVPDLPKSASVSELLHKIGEGSPHVVDWIERGEVDLVINTPIGTGARTDGYEIRSAAIARGIPCITTMSGGIAAARAIAAARRTEPGVLSLQEIHAHVHGHASARTPDLRH